MGRITSLVTGGGGFLGKHIVKKLLERGDNVTVIGRNFYRDVELWGASSWVVDIRNKESLDPSFKGIDEVYHVASVANLWGDWKLWHWWGMQESVQLVKVWMSNWIN